MIDKLIDPAAKIIGKYVKDKDLQAKLDFEMATLFHKANLAQIEVNKIEAKGSAFSKKLAALCRVDFWCCPSISFLFGTNFRSNN